LPTTSLVKRSTRPRADGGFTLVELGVTLLIVGILVAIAIPVYQGIVNQTRDKQMQSDLRAAFQVQALVLLREGAFSSDEATLHAAEPTLVYSALGAPGAVTPVTKDPATTGVCLYGLSISGRWFSVYYAADAATLFGEAAPQACTAGLVAGWSHEPW
jgi:type IV pilus assembly protein PilA